MLIHGTPAAARNLSGNWILVINSESGRNLKIVSFVVFSLVMSGCEPVWSERELLPGPHRPVKGNGHNTV